MTAAEKVACRRRKCHFSAGKKGIEFWATRFKLSTDGTNEPEASETSGISHFDFNPHYPGHRLKQGHGSRIHVSDVQPHSLVQNVMTYALGKATLQQSASKDLLLKE